MASSAISIASSPMYMALNRLGSAGAFLGHCRHSVALGGSQHAGTVPYCAALFLTTVYRRCRLRAWARPCHICAATGLAPATFAPRLGSPLPHLHRNWAHPCHICTGTGLTPAALPARGICARNASYELRGTALISAPVGPGPGLRAQHTAHSAVRSPKPHAAGCSGSALARPTQAPVHALHTLTRRL